MLKLWRMGSSVMRVERVSLSIFFGSVLFGVILFSQAWDGNFDSLQSLSLSVMNLRNGVSFYTTLSPPPVNWASIPRLKTTPQQAPDHPKWIVATSINPPTEAISILANLSGWHVVVVGDTKSPKDWKLDGVIFLDIDAQAKLGYRILKHVPFRSYARKNVGYLYALQHGAKVIYETDDDNLLTVPEIEKGFDVEMESPGEMLEFEARQGRDVVNPYVHFGQPSMWPRGYPLEAVERNAAEKTYAVLPKGQQLIQQGLANGDPDVDGIFRLTRRTEGQLIRVAFDSAAPAVALPPGTMCPFNSQNTLFHRDAFWALMIPISTAFRVCDIWRGYWAQRLLWDVGGLLAFYPPSVRQDRNIHNFYNDFLDEKALYEDSGNLVRFLLSWKSDRTHFFDRVLHLSYAMARDGFWGAADAEMTLAWLQDLISLGYAPPPLRDPPPQSAERRVFTPATLPSSHLLPPGVPPVEGALDQGLRQLAESRRFFRDVVLILNYNWPHHDSVLFWRMVYGRVFKHVVVISTEGDDSLGIMGVSDANNGWTTYRALPEVYARFPEAEGFLLTNDDVLLNYWNLLGADKSKIWHIQNCTDCFPGWIVFSHLEQHTRSRYWTHPSQKYAQMQVIGSLDKEHQDRFHRAVPEGFGVVATSDFYYVPKRFVGGMSELIPKFAEKRARSEMAIPAMLLCLAEVSSDFDESAFSHSLYIWHKDRRLDPNLFYTPKLHAFHPWKPKDQLELNRILEALSQGDPQLGWLSIGPVPPATNQTSVP